MSDRALHAAPLQSLALKEKVNPMKFKERASEDSLTCRSLLLWMVRLIHADPMLMLNVSLNSLIEYTSERAG